MLSLFDEFISSHLDVLIEKVTSENLLSIFMVEGLRMEESISQYSFIDEVHILVVEEYVIVVEE